MQQLEPETSRVRIGAMLARANISAGSFDSLYPRSGAQRSSHNQHADAQLEAHYADPQHVGIIVNFYMDDYLLFEISVPPWALEKLQTLTARNDPHAVSREHMELLKGFAAKGGVRRP